MFKAVSQVIVLLQSARAGNQKIFRCYSHYARSDKGWCRYTLNELICGSGKSINLHEGSLPVKEEVKGICEMLGMDPLYVANEGKTLIITDETRQMASSLKESVYGKDATIIGTVTDHYRTKYISVHLQEEGVLLICSQAISKDAVALSVEFCTDWNIENVFPVECQLKDLF